MKQTPLRDYFNADVLALVPKEATRVVEVGCGNGAMAREYRKINPRCEYVGIEIVPEYAEASGAYCTRVLIGNIERMSEGDFQSLFPSSCWIFSDVLEHLYDPWAVLRRIRSAIAADSSVIASIPNAQHWSIQRYLNRGDLMYKEIGLMDRTHIRWFTRITISELFGVTGFKIVEGGGIIVDELPEQRATLEGIRALARVAGTDPEEAVADATPFQWIVRAMPAPAEEAR